MPSCQSMHIGGEPQVRREQILDVYDPLAGCRLPSFECLAAPEQPVGAAAIAIPLPAPPFWQRALFNFFDRAAQVADRAAAEAASAAGVKLISAISAGAMVIEPHAAAATLLISAGVLAACALWRAWREQPCRC